MIHGLAGQGLSGRLATAAVAGLLGAGLVGCQHSDRPHDYGQERPSVDDLDRRDGGLQSRDVNEAADRLAARLLATPEINNSPRQLTVVLYPVEDNTRDRMFLTDYDIFLQALKARVAEQGRGRVQLVTSRDKFYRMRDKERDAGGRDEFGQGGGGRAAAPDRVQPDYALTGVVRDLARRGTVFYSMDFTLNDLRSGIELWSGEYQVKVAR